MKRRIFVFFVGIYLLTLTTPFDSIDGQTMYDTSRALAFEQTIAFPDDFYSPQLRPGKDGRKYSQYDPGLPLLAAPTVAFSDNLAKSQLWNRYAFSAYMVLWVSVLFVSAGLCGLYTLADEIYQHRKTAFLIVFAAGLCTFVWYYARSFFPEGTLAGLLMLAFYGAYRGTMFSILGAGLALGMMMLIRAPMVIYVVPVGWLVLRLPHPPAPSPQAEKGSFRKLYLRGGGMLLIFPFLAGLGLLYHNYLRYGELFTSGYAYSGQEFSTPVWVGIYGMLLSPGKGVFWYVPILFLSVWKFPAFYRKNIVLAQAILIATGLVLVFYGRWWAWHGGWCWGARFLVPILPLWMLPLGEIDLTPQPPLRKSERGRENLTALKHGVIIVLFILSFLISLLGVITNVNYTYEAHPEDMIHYTVSGSLIIGALEIVLETRTEYLVTFYLGRIGMAQGTAILVPGVLVLWVFYQLWKMVYQENINERQQ